MWTIIALVLFYRTITTWVVFIVKSPFRSSIPYAPSLHESYSTSPSLHDFYSIWTLNAWVLFPLNKMGLPCINIPNESSIYKIFNFCSEPMYTKALFPPTLVLTILKGLSVEYEGWGCCISFDSSSFKELSRCYEKCWKSAAIFLFAKIMCTLLHRENFRHCSNALRIL